MEENNLILYFDGVCNLCSKLVQFVIRNDKRKRVRFSPLQDHPELADSPTVIVRQDDQLFYKSDAILKLLVALGGGWTVFRLGYILPKFLRDRVYDFIAFRRYGWFGKTDECMLPTPEIRDRFLEREIS
ncbi:MAG TPA: DCC1-like thiol-disulfide oxidoreductase family protein [Flavipsychrobacter sp.]|nr:DCC1-like thiol-disulfide oxidoreductase family protein [Flavipsychrobacter sp.]